MFCQVLLENYYKKKHVPSRKRLLSELTIRSNECKPSIMATSLSVSDLLVVFGICLLLVVDVIICVAFSGYAVNELYHYINYRFGLRPTKGLTNLQGTLF